MYEILSRGKMNIQGYTVVQSDSGSLLPGHSRLWAAIEFLLVMGFQYFWFYLLLRDDSLEWGQKLRELAPDPFMWLSILFLSLFLPTLINSARTVLFGEEFHFDITSRGMLKNGNPLASFESIQELKMEAHHDEDGTSYGLRLILKDGRKYSLVSDQRIEYATELADDIAEITGTQIVGCESDRAKMFSEGGIHF